MQKSCQTCHKNFKLIPQELQFYNKIGVPQPNNCPTCRQKRRMSLRNDQKFHKYPCNKCGKDMVTTVNPNKKLIVYCLDCYTNFRANVDLTKIDS